MRTVRASVSSTSATTTMSTIRPAVMVFSYS
jgi:hypothetical protein